jgi:hypothetical protein
VDAFTLWEAFRAPGGGDDVILRHGSNSILGAVSSDWPGVVALDYSDQNPTMVMRWVVAEAIPPRPGPEVPPGPTKVSSGLLGVLRKKGSGLLGNRFGGAGFLERTSQSRNGFGGAGFLEPIDLTCDFLLTACLCQNFEGNLVHSVLRFLLCLLYFY